MIQYLWKSKPESPEGDVPPGAIAFTFHQKSGIKALLFGFLFASIVEAVTLHVLLAMLNHWLAFAATIATLYFSLQVIAQIRAVGMRPIYYLDETLVLRNGAFDIAEVPFNAIEHVELTSRNIKTAEGDLNPLSVTFPAGHNVVVRLKSPMSASILNRSKRDFDVALLAIDDVEKFRTVFDQKLTS